MDTNKHAIVLEDEPLEGWTTDDVREWLECHPEDRSLAAAMASTHNKVVSLMHEDDDSDNPCPEEIYDQWWDLECEILDEIGLRFYSNAEWESQKKMGTHKAVEPFMNDHGYVDGAGWWMPGSPKSTCKSKETGRLKKRSL